VFFWLLTKECQMTLPSLPLQVAVNSAPTGMVRQIDIDTVSSVQSMLLGQSCNLMPAGISFS
jgi:hypothetical protein